MGMNDLDTRIVYIIFYHSNCILIEPSVARKNLDFEAGLFSIIRQFQIWILTILENAYRYFQPSLF